MSEEGNSMLFVYNCYGGTHTSVIAAAIHLDRLPRDRVPTKKEIESSYLFNKLSSKDMGHLIYHGTDEQGNRVYTMGRGTSKVIITALEQLYRIFKQDAGEADRIIFSNTSPTVPFIMTIGGFTAKTLRLNLLGKPLILIGAKQCYPDIVNLVNDTKQKSATINNDCIVLDHHSVL